MSKYLVSRARKGTNTGLTSYFDGEIMCLIKEDAKSLDLSMSGIVRDVVRKHYESLGRTKLYEYYVFDEVEK